MPVNYFEFIEKLKNRIKQQRLKTVMAVNSTLVMMYWDIGNAILEKQKSEGWGAKVIDRLSYDLKEEFSDLHGFSPRNLKYMRKFAENWPEKAIVQELLAQISWYHNLALMEKLTERQERLWYARMTTRPSAFCWLKKKIIPWPSIPLRVIPTP
jgi:predicted nuclease of restriction endonuclease-like (RecB) superfamily